MRYFNYIGERRHMGETLHIIKFEGDQSVSYQRANGTVSSFRSFTISRDMLGVRFHEYEELV